MSKPWRIGVVSDTHGLVRPEAVALLEGSDLIVHAGDVGDPAVLDALDEIAPVHAVRGNVDRGVWADSLPDTLALEVGSRLLWVLHDVNELDLDPAAGGFSVVISGHSHKPSVHWKDDVLYLNPGSIGPRRFTLPIGLAHLVVSDTHVDAELVPLDV